MTHMKSNLIPRIVEGSEERQALNVIHVGVGKENVGIKNIPFLQHDLLAKGTNTGACINDDAARTTSNLKAGRVSAIFNGIRPRTSNTPPGPPKLKTKICIGRHR